MATTRFDRAPHLTQLYLKAALPSRRRNESLPDDELVLDAVDVDCAHLAEYNRVCGYRLADGLPLTYPHIVAFPLAVSLMTDPRFPFALPGLVHIANRIQQHRPILTSDRLTMRVRAENLRPHHKGRQFDVVAVAQVAGEDVWVEHSTYLKRGGEGGGEDGAAEELRRPETGGDGAAAGSGRSPAAVWRIPADTGRRYAAVSGDRNPIHLHPLSARLFGFPRAIAHGMWTKARCLGALEGRLGPAVTAQVRFTKPVLLPATAAFAQSNHDTGLRFSLRDARRSTPYLDGSIEQ